MLASNSAGFIGSICLGLTLALSLLGTLACTRFVSVALPGAAKLCNRLIYGAFIGVLAAVFTLYQAIFTNDFSLGYVYGYSSIDLPLIYKISVLWAGQEGSLLFWLFVHALAGAILITCQEKAVSDRDVNSHRATLVIYLAVQALLAVLVLAKSPFAVLDIIPADGVGLNPLLMDPWMAIHPPVVFVGYALLAVTYAYSLGALLSNDTGVKWLSPAIRWGFISWGFLGAGIFIGGYWAYKVLGWGGYWGWDPVENSSLVPWLVSGIALHLLLLARHNRAVTALAHLSVILSYALVYYATFLTRSGILGDFSVHSFSGSTIGGLLAIADAAILLAGLILLFLRIDNLPKGRLYNSLNDKSFILLFAMLTMGFIALLVFIGMSMPLFTELISSPAAVDISFYPRTTAPPFALLLLLVIWLLFRQVDHAKAVAGGGFLAGIAIAVVADVSDILPLVIAGLGGSASALILKVKGLFTPAGRLAHLGLTLGAVALILSGSGSREEHLTLNFDEAVPVFDHEIAYLGYRLSADAKEKYYDFTVDSEPVVAVTKIDDTGRDAAREPAIHRTVIGDIYLAPTAPDRLPIKELILKRNIVVIEDDLAFRYRGITEERTDTGNVDYIAEVEVTDGEDVDVATPAIHTSDAGSYANAKDFLDGRHRLRLTGIADGHQEIRLELLAPLSEEIKQPIAVSISTKPFIALLWLSAVFITLGSLLACRRGT